MGTNDAESDLDRELARLKLRDIVIGSAVAAVLLAMMPGHTQRGTASTAPGRSRISTPLLPKHKADCTKSASTSCSAKSHPGQHAAASYLTHKSAAHHAVDIRV